MGRATGPLGYHVPGSDNNYSRHYPMTEPEMRFALDDIRHVHKCPGCRTPAAHKCECPDPSAPRPCNERVPGDRNLNCPTIPKSSSLRWWEQAK
jgi:hypothetical protein